MAGRLGEVAQGELEAGEVDGVGEGGLEVEEGVLELETGGGGRSGLVAL